MSKLKISVVVPFYNTPIKYFKKCIDNLKKIDPYEVILVDDCSTNVEVINEALDSGFKYFKTPYQSGFDGLPFNIGVQNATGDYICRVDSDDVLLELPTFMDTDICFGRAKRVRPADNLTLEKLILSPRALLNALVIRRDILLKHPAEIDPNVYGDVLLILQFLYHNYSFRIFPKVNYIYTKRENSVQTSSTPLHHRLTHIQTVARFCQIEKLSKEDSEKLLSLAFLNFRHGSRALNYTRYKNFEKFML